MTEPIAQGPGQLISTIIPTSGVVLQRWNTDQGETLTMDVPADGAVFRDPDRLMVLAVTLAGLVEDLGGPKLAVVERGDPGEVLRLIRYGIGDPGATVRRGVEQPDGGTDYSEPLVSWGARAVVANLQGAGLLPAKPYAEQVSEHVPAPRETQ